jgi:DNA-binding NarL/FixJ family response regulator
MSGVSLEDPLIAGSGPAESGLGKSGSVQGSTGLRPGAGDALRLEWDRWSIGAGDKASVRRAPGEETVAIQVHCRDAICELGLLAQLRQCPDVRIVPPGGSASVVVAAADRVDEEVTRWLRSLHRSGGAPIVLVVGQLDPRTVTEVVCSGVRGVLPRSEAAPDRLGRLIRAAAHGNGELPPDLLRHLIDQVNRLNQELLEPSGRHSSGLTERERHVLKLVSEGLSTREVAIRLAYSERTIKAILQSLTLRLNVRNRTQAVAYAVRNGWI